MTGEIDRDQIMQGFDLMWEGVRIKFKGQWERVKEELDLGYMLRSLGQLSGEYIGGM